MARAPLALPDDRIPVRTNVVRREPAVRGTLGS